MFGFKRNPIPYSGLEVDSITPFQAYIEKAKEWWTKALKNGNNSAKERLEKIY